MNRFRLAAIGIVVCALVLAISSNRGDVFVVDEVPHVGAGYSYLVAQDMRLNPEHPPLVKDLAVLPLLALHLSRTAFTQPPWTEFINGQWDFGRALIYTTGNDADRMKDLARLPVLLFFIGSAALMYVWTRRISNEGGAVLAVFLFSFSPTIMAHARLVTTDTAAAFGVLAATYTFVRFLDAPRRTTFLWAAAAFGIALLTKFSTFLLVPYLGLVAVLYGIAHASGIRARLFAFWEYGWRAVAVFAIGFIGIVLPVYLFHVWHYPPELQRRDIQQNLGSFPVRPVVQSLLWMSDVPVLRAAAQYGHGLAMVFQRSEGGNRIYWRGDVVNSGGPLYFPLVYLLKESLAWWALVLVACVTALALRRTEPTNRFRFWSMLSMLLWLGIYWLVSVQSRLNIGIRHIIPTFPFAIMLVSAEIARMGVWAQRRSINAQRIATVLIAILLGSFASESIHAWPSYLTYFNQLAGGTTNGYKTVVDSNLDWGQDLKRLRDWMDTNGVASIGLDYFGWAEPGYYLHDRVAYVHAGQFADASAFLRETTTDGWIAISATYFQNANGRKNLAGEPESTSPTWRWLIPYRPMTVIGNSIFVWHIEK